MILNYFKILFYLNQNSFQLKKKQYSIKTLFNLKKVLLYSINTHHHLKKLLCIQNYLNFEGLFNKSDFMGFSSEILV